MPVKTQRPALSHRLLLGLPVILGGMLALAAPLLAGSTSAAVLGFLLVAAGGVQIVNLLVTPGGIPSKAAFVAPGASVVAGLLLMEAPGFTFSALAALLGLAIVVDGGGKVVAGLRSGAREIAPWAAVDGGFKVLLGLAVALQWPIAGEWSLGVVVGLWLLSTGWELLSGKEPKPVSAEEVDITKRHPDPKLKLPPNPLFARVRERFLAEEKPRHQISRYWRWVFILTFFIIHAGRMQVEGTVGGWWGPAMATVGDVLVALLLAFLVVGPVRLFWRWLTRPWERRAWRRYLRRLDSDPDARPSFRERWVLRRMRADLYDLRGRRSPSAIIGWGLTYGLPLAAVLVAITPVLGFSWFFNTESWTAALNEQWATERTDPWREAMVKAVREEFPTVSDSERFQVNPEGVQGGDFSFLVIGDPGEGDPSQYVLHDQILRVGNRPEVKFMVISSDVIYPSGEIHDYEDKFYLPFKGFDEPIYAIPGNHDWFDGLDGFSANFFEPKAAVTAMRARRTADLNLTAPTEEQVDDLVSRARALRDYYGLSVAHQRGPFFELQTDDFALLALDTGVLRTTDPAQMAWFRNALDRARDKFKMVILGHPLYATGRYQGNANPDFRAIHHLLREHSVEVVMAGDTHAFEFYREPGTESARPTLYFTNGGGGAYLSIESPLDWAEQPPVKNWAYYPRTDRITAKLDAQVPLWQRPLWLWVKHFDAWPMSIQPLATAFSYDKAPFFQSFMEVRVERSANRVLLRLYGVQGALRWRDLQIGGEVLPSGKGRNDNVEFVVPLNSTE
ncbi:metallophosphoesterase [Thiohalomonas denitrificans]|uniref:metallophosphoesterase n=1 Tax=Thiohalomonas denitrificans TaxID=415747 RepID=UPI0026EF1606|nr:metallophosphoesterase [Thiohalomonas denitrificans]